MQSLGNPIVLLGQLIGFGGVALMCLSYQFKKSSTLFMIQLAASLLFCIHFLLLGAYTGLIMNGLEILREYLLLQEKKKWASSKPVVYGMALLMGAAGLVTWQGWPSIFPIIASVVGTPILWMRSPKAVRIGGLCVISPCWMAYNICVFSIAGIVTEALSMSSILISFIRYKGFSEPGDAA